MTENYFKNTASNTIPNDITSQILKTSDASVFHASLPGYQPTPLRQLPELSKKYKVGNIYIKDESKRFGLNAFKVLGASYAMNQLLEQNPGIETFCTATDGNHGRAVAWSAQRLDKKSVVYVPQDTTTQRKKQIEQAGARVIQVNGNYDAACQQAKNTSKTNHWSFIQDTAWPDYLEIPALIMAGYQTLFKELEDSLHIQPNPKIDIVFMQAGVGSLAAAGIFYYLNKYGTKRPKIVIVEPQEADGILTSFKNNEITTSHGNSTTIMAGLNCGTPSIGAWKLLKNGTDYAIKVNDNQAKQAMRELYYPTSPDEKIISGESGAGGLAGFLAIMKEHDLKKVKEDLGINAHSQILFLNTEGDTDKQVFDQIISSN